MISDGNDERYEGESWSAGILPAFLEAPIQGSQPSPTDRRKIKSRRRDARDGEAKREVATRGFLAGIGAVDRPRALRGAAGAASTGGFLLRRGEPAFLGVDSLTRAPGSAGASKRKRWRERRFGSRGMSILHFFGRARQVPGSIQRSPSATDPFAWGHGSISIRDGFISIRDGFMYGQLIFGSRAPDQAW